MSKLKFQTNMSAYEAMEFWELHAIQQVHITDYTRVKNEIALLEEVGASSREIAELLALKDGIYKVINDFGILLDAMDGTKRS